MRKHFAVACLLCGASLTHAQYVDVTSIDLQTETNKVTVVQTIDKTIRPKGLIGGVGYGVEISRLQEKSDYFSITDPIVFHGVRGELGYQLSPRVAMNLGICYESALFPVVCSYNGERELEEGDNKGGGNTQFLLEAFFGVTYYFSPKIDKGLFISAAVGEGPRYLFCSSGGWDTGSSAWWKDQSSGLTYRADYRCTGSLYGPEPMYEVILGYAWKHFKIQGIVAFRSMYYQYQFYNYSYYYDSNDFSYGSNNWLEDIDTRRTDICFGLNASVYFNTGYRKLRKGN